MRNLQLNSISVVSINLETFKKTKMSSACQNATVLPLTPPLPLGANDR
jgi:hypothetical protein